MCHETVLCDRCGEPASVIHAAPIFTSSDALFESDASQTVVEYSCRVNCPNCGVQVQVVKA
jgi:hypothetical protein